MKEISEGVYTVERVENPYFTASPVVIVGNKSLILYDTGVDGITAQTHGGDIGRTTFGQVMQFSEELGKPIGHIFLSHYHLDHTQDILLYNKGVVIHAHENVNQSLPNLQIHEKYNKDTNLQLEGINLEVILTPGHSKVGDDISLALPDKKLILVGDTVQPHGKSYEKGEKFIWLPFYVRGDDYKESLSKIKEYGPEYIQTAHLGTTDMVGLEAIAKTIGSERGVPPEAINKRIQTNFFRRYDFIGILYFIEKARKN